MMMVAKKVGKKLAISKELINKQRAVLDFRWNWARQRLDVQMDSKMAFFPLKEK
jgi:hypothetical protein